MLKTLLSNSSFMGTVYVTLGSLVAGVLNYLFQLFLANYISPAEYGIFNTLLSLSVVLGIPIGAFSTALIKVVAELYSEKNHDVLHKLFINLNILFFIIGGIFCLNIILLNQYLQKFLNIYNTNIFISFAFFTLFSFLGIVPVAYLQGLLKFKSFAFYNISSGVFKLFYCFIIISLGFKVAGIFFGTALTNISLFILGSFLLFNTLQKSSTPINLTIYYKKIFKISSITLFFGIGMTLLNNVDLIMVSRYFSNEELGIYSATLTVGKILLFGAGIITMVMYPQISSLYSKKASYYKTFFTFLILQLGVITFGVLVFIMFPNLIITTLFNQAFFNTSQYLFYVAIFIWGYTMLNFMITFFIAINKNNIVFILLLGIVLQVILLSIFHSNLYQVFMVNQLVVYSLLLIMVLYAGVSFLKPFKMIK